MIRRNDIHWGQVATIASIAMGLYVFWNSLALYPFRILVVFFHELGHALATWVTGGQVVTIQLDPFEGGYCVTRGGNRFLILSSGYIGSVAIGGALLWLSRKIQRPEVAVAIIGGLLACVTLAWVRPFAGFGFAFGLVAGIGLTTMAFAVHRWANRAFLQILGVLSCLYAIWDIVNDVISRPGVESDARMLAEITGIPTFIWGLVWLVIALAATAEFLVRASRKRTGE